MTPATLARGQSVDLIPLFTPDRLRAAIIRSVFFIIVGGGCYGFTVGLWRGSEMALYVAIKTPALLFFTLLITGLLNGILGLLLGTGIGFRQSLLCQLLAFSLAAIVLASLAPITVFLALQAPPSDSPQAATSHSFYLLTHTGIIAIGGILAVTRLFGLIRDLTPNYKAARITLLSWLASNAFVGAQLSYLLRPFFGTPTLEIAFLRPKPFDGTFYEAVWHALNRFLSTEGSLILLFAAACALALFLKSLLTESKPSPSNTKT